MAAERKHPLGLVSSVSQSEFEFMLDYEHVVVYNPQFFGAPDYRGATIDCRTCAVDLLIIEASMLSNPPVRRAYWLPI